MLMQGKNPYLFTFPSNCLIFSCTKAFQNSAGEKNQSFLVEIFGMQSHMRSGIYAISIVNHGFDHSLV